MFKFVGSEDVATTVSLGVGKTFFLALEKSPNILEFNLLEINLVLVVKILSLELNGAHINECVFRLSLLLEGLVETTRFLLSGSGSRNGLFISDLGGRLLNSRHDDRVLKRVKRGSRVSLEAVTLEESRIEVEIREVSLRERGEEGRERKGAGGLVGSASERRVVVFN